MKNILIYSYSLPPKIDGVTYRILMWLEGFKRYRPDYNIVLLTPRSDVADTVLGYPVYKLHGGHVPKLLTGGNQNNIIINKKRYIFQNYKILKAVVIKHNIEFIYVTGPESLFPFSLLKKRFKDIVMTFTYHTHGAMYVKQYFTEIFNERVGTVWSNAVTQLQHYAGLESFDQICSMSSVLNKFVEEKLSFEHQKKIVIPPIIDRDIFPFKSKVFSKLTSIKCVYVGRIADEKNIRLLLETLYKFWDATYLPLEYNIIGNGPKLDDLRDQFSERKSNLIINFHGAIQREDVHHYYHENDIFLFPSLTETLGFVTIEAMSCGIPIIAANGGGTTTLIDSESGVLLDEEHWKTKEICDQIQTLAMDSKKRETMVKAAYQRTENFSIKKNIEFLDREVFSK